MNTNKKVRIYGAGGHSQVIKEVLEDNGYIVSEIFDDKPETTHFAQKMCKWVPEKI